MLAIARVVWRNIRTTGRTARGIIASATDAERVTSGPSLRAETRRRNHGCTVAADRGPRTIRVAQAPE